MEGVTGWLWEGRGTVGDAGWLDSGNFAAESLEREQFLVKTRVRDCPWQ